MASKPIYKIYAELENYKPKIWRRFIVMDNITMSRFGYILMTLFEMRANHLFSFEIPNFENCKQHGIFESVDPKDLEIQLEDRKKLQIELLDNMNESFSNEKKDTCMLEASTSVISKILTEAKDKGTFYYDFGDNWTINFKVEEIFIDSEISGRDLPKVLEGNGYGIIEDCGGVDGLEHLSTCFKEKSGDDYKSYCEWLGLLTLDIDAFDLDDMNFRVKKLPRIFTDIYEKSTFPTDKSIAIINREY